MVKQLKTIVGVLTYNAISTLRFELLEHTVASLRQAFEGPIYVLDNGSNDGSANALKDLESMNDVFTCAHVSRDGNTSPGRGRNQLMRLLRQAAHQPYDVVVLSDDDMVWGLEAGPLLGDLWAYAPDDLVLVSGLLEEYVWPWNEPREAITCGGVRLLVRDSTPAAAWSFRMRDWDKVFPLKETLEGDGEDYDACKRLRAAGLRVAQLDLATHIGEGYSQLGNDEIRSVTTRALESRRLDLKRWGM